MRKKISFQLLLAILVSFVCVAAVDAAPKKNTAQTAAEKKDLEETMEWLKAKLELPIDLYGKRNFYSSIDNKTVDVSRHDEIKMVIEYSGCNVKVIKVQIVTETYSWQPAKINKYEEISSIMLKDISEVRTGLRNDPIYTHEDNVLFVKLSTFNNTKSVRHSSKHVFSNEDDEQSLHKYDTEEMRDSAFLLVQDKTVADRIVKAIDHVRKICGANDEKF